MIGPEARHPASNGSKYDSSLHPGIQGAFVAWGDRGSIRCFFEA